jgi:hypothetical protein
LETSVTPKAKVMFKWDGGAESPPNVISPPVTDIVSVGYIPKGGK